MSNRDCEQRPWVRFHAVVDSDRLYKLGELTHAVRLMNAAVATTIVLDRMVRWGRSARL
jgi:hypothetical protein